MSLDTAGDEAPENDPPFQPVASPSRTIDNDPERFWASFGFQVTADDRAALTGRLPVGLVVLTGTDERALTDTAKPLPGPPVHVTADSAHYYLYRVDAASDERIELPPGVRLIEAGDVMPLPAGEDFTPERYHFQSLKDLPPLLHRQEPASKPAAPVWPVVSTPLDAFSLRGQAAKFEDAVVKAEPVLGDLCLAGQSTIWYAAPNAGKTLIALKLVLEAVDANRITPDNVYYINADDGNEGFATKLRILDDIGVHTLAPGLAGFSAGELAGLLREMAASDAALGTVVIVDTLKKFADLMHKKEASAFGDAARLYVMKGGTLLGLAHVNKNPGANGKLSYAGVADIVQDADAAYLMAALEGMGDQSERVVQFEAFKLRGPGVRKVAYAYAAEDGLSYHERLASVRTVDPQRFDEFERFQAEKSDAAIISAVADCIGEGVVQKMALAKAVAVRAHVAERAAIRVIEAYTGEDPARHRWTYRVRERGAKVFELLPMPMADEPSSPP